MAERAYVCQSVGCKANGLRVVISPINMSGVANGWPTIACKWCDATMVDVHVYDESQR